MDFLVIPILIIAMTISYIIIAALTIIIILSTITGICLIAVGLTWIGVKIRRSLT